MFSVVHLIVESIDHAILLLDTLLGLAEPSGKALTFQFEVVDAFLPLFVHAVQVEHICKLETGNTGERETKRHEDVGQHRVMNFLSATIEIRLEIEIGFQ